jgi:CRISPR-associated protein Csm4
MQQMLITIKPLTAFGDSIKGDSLFGQFCWAILHRYGKQRLDELLDGYTQNNPYLICSDVFPSGFIIKPSLPLHFFEKIDGEQRKQIKQRQWMPVERIESTPISQWLNFSLSEQQAARTFSEQTTQLYSRHLQVHNSIHRLLNTTEGGEFAPYEMPQLWFHPAIKLQIYLLFDEQKLNKQELLDIINDLAGKGIGRDASIGLGKFKIEDHQNKFPVNHQKDANAWINLAPIAPQNLEFDADNSFYQPFTRFGRHGDMAVLTGKPFKNPILLADTGGVFTFKKSVPQAQFIGQGLGGQGSLSKAPGFGDTVHQAYAPCIGINNSYITVNR